LSHSFFQRYSYDVPEVYHYLWLARLVGLLHVTSYPSAASLLVPPYTSDMFIDLKSWLICTI